MNTKYLVKTAFKNPITEYLYFVLNFIRNKFRYEHISQEYLSLVIRSNLEKNIRIYDHAIVKKSKIGTYTYVGRSSRVNRASIGRFCCIGPNCIIGTGRHPSRTYVSSHPAFYSTGRQVGLTFSDKNYYEELGSVVIGNDVWLGTNVIVADSVKIGDGAIIAAGAVVTKDIPAYAIYGGVPAKLIRYRFEQDVIEFLLKFKWWGKDETWWKENFKEFHDITEFIRNYGPCILE